MPRPDAEPRELYGICAPRGLDPDPALRVAERLAVHDMRSAHAGDAPPGNARHLAPAETHTMVRGGRYSAVSDA